MVSVHVCSWLTSWWGKGVFYSPWSPYSEHNRVPHTHYLITSKNRCLHISSTRNLQREKRPTFLFLIFFPSASCAWSNVTLWATTGQLSYFLLFTRRWLHKRQGPEGTRGPTAPAQPLLDPPGARSPISVWFLCWGPSVLHHSFFSILSPASSPSAPDGSSWMVPGPYHFPCQGPLVDFVTAIVSTHHSQSLWGSIHWRGHGLCWSHLQVPAPAPLGRAVPHWGNQLWRYKSGKGMAMNHLHLAIFLCSGSKEHPWLCATWTENICSLSLVCCGGFAREQGGRDGAQTPRSSCFRAI